MTIYVDLSTPEKFKDFEEKYIQALKSRAFETSDKGFDLEKFVKEKIIPPQSELDTTLPPSSSS